MIGAVTIGRECCVGDLSVLRGDVNSITLGDRVKIGPGVVVHVSGDLSQPYSTSIGSDVSIGASTVLHGCTLEDQVTVEPGCIVLDGAVVGARSRLRAGSLLGPGKTIPADEDWAGSPARSLGPRCA